MTNYVDPDDLEAKAAEWTEAQLDCRVNIYHAWNRRNTYLVKSSRGALTVRQRCSRRCGVEREATMNQRTGHLTSRWKLVYPNPRAEKYLLRNEHGKSMGRIDHEGKARLRLLAWSNLPVLEVEDDA